MSAFRIGFVGAGRMATALARGMITGGITEAEHICASDISEHALGRFAAESGAMTAASNSEVLSRSDVVILAVKPQSLSQALGDMAEQVTAEHLIVSIVAGMPISAITEQIGTDKRVIRVMPNTPALIGAGAAAYALGDSATSEDAESVDRLLSTVGIAVAVPEHLLDAVTGLSGSGPAYGFLMIEALSDGGVRCGLPRDIATQLAAQTLLGAARMVLETGQHPGELKDAVTSPGGTTIAGVHQLESGRIRGCLMDAVLATTRRSQELAHGE